MKVLSLKQPFAELVVSGRKTIEIRTWKTNFRGRFLIHASKIPDKNAMKRFDFNKLPVGQIIGEAELVDVREYKSKQDFAKDFDKHLSNSSFEKFGFVLKNMKRIKLIEAKGALGFWEFKQK